MSDAQIDAFGHTPDERSVQRIRLTSGDMVVSILTLGGILQDLRLAGLPYALVTGFSSAEEYLGANKYCGAIVGPVAGRIRGAEAQIGQQLWRFKPNEGHQLLHGGASGVHQRIWQVADLGADHLTLALTLGHCEGGFPGKRRIEARYGVAGQTLSLDLVTHTDRPTLSNLAPHMFWNLTGRADLSGHRLRVAADHVLPIGPELYPTGDPVPVSGIMDLRQGQLLGQGKGYDHCFCLSRTRISPRPVAWLDVPNAPAAPRLEMATSEPGLQVFDAAHHATRPFFGVALESQSWPDAPHHATFPSILLRPEDGPLIQSTSWTLRQQE